MPRTKSLRQQGKNGSQKGRPHSAACDAFIENVECKMNQNETWRDALLARVWHLNVFAYMTANVRLTQAVEVCVQMSNKYSLPWNSIRNMVSSLGNWSEIMVSRSHWPSLRLDPTPVKSLLQSVTSTMANQWPSPIQYEMKKWKNASDHICPSVSFVLFSCQGSRMSSAPKDSDKVVCKSVPPNDVCKTLLVNKFPTWRWSSETFPSPIQ